MEGLEELPLVGEILVENPLISWTCNLSGMFEYIWEGLGSHSVTCMKYVRIVRNHEK